MNNAEQYELSQHITELLRDFCDNEAITPETELLESDLLDSLAFLQLLSALEDEGRCIQPTQFPRKRFSTPKSIAEICAETEQQ